MKKLLCLRIFGALCFFAVTILAQVPQLLNYRGRLTDNSGVPISTATTLIFNLYQGGDTLTPLSGLLVYEEEEKASFPSKGKGEYRAG